MPRPTLSLIVPTRGRPERLRIFLDSIAATASRPERLEVILVVDADDPASLAVSHTRLTLRHVVVPPGLTMGALNCAGYEASRGDYLMLLNDDVVVRTRGWDRTTLACFRRFPDPFVLVHVNDTLIREHLCTFPMVSREYCELAGGICPREFVRYRIDDHIEDTFNLLAAAGVHRTVYLPDVVFEHDNAVQHPTAGRVYMSDPAILALDAPRFDEQFPFRKALALKLLHAIGCAGEIRTRLEAISADFELRTPGRQLVLRAPWWQRTGELRAQATRYGQRIRQSVRTKGWKALWHSVRRQMSRS
jgi:hypothetical protein